MSKEVCYFSIIKDYNGEIDFQVSAMVCELDSETFNKIREMIVVGIGTMEHMYRNAYVDKNKPCNTTTLKE
jgi:hypothetical protein